MLRNYKVHDAQTDTEFAGEKLWYVLITRIHTSIQHSSKVFSGLLHSESCTQTDSHLQQSFVLGYSLAALRDSPSTAYDNDNHSFLMKERTTKYIFQVDLAGTKPTRNVNIFHLF